MDQFSTQLEKLKTLLQNEHKNYKQAIADNKTFEETKAIYLKIKDLQRQANDLMQQANKHQMDRSF